MDAAYAGAVMEELRNMQRPDRSMLGFPESVRESFDFLSKAGFIEIESLPTLVRYRRGGVEVYVFHGRKSYEVGCEVSILGGRFAISEIVRAVDPGISERYRNVVATTREGVATAVQALSRLLQSFGASALNGDRHFASALELQRKQWSEDYAIEVLAGQLRPKAADAFRRGDYSTAAELYGRIRERLTPTEAKKLALAEERSGPTKSEARPRGS